MGFQGISRVLVLKLGGGYTGFYIIMIYLTYMLYYLLCT